MTIIVPDEVKKTLETFETKHEPFAEYELHGAIRKSFSPTKETPQEIKNGWWVELAAFNFLQSSPGETSKWGTHFGPMSEFSYQDGTVINIPDIKEIDEEVISYWKRRAEESKHPICKARYADLIWNFSYPVTSQKADIKYAHIAIDSYIAASELVSEDTQMQCRTRLERALELAILIGDRDRISAVKRAMFALHAKIAEPGKIGTWRFLFDSLYDNKKVELTDDETDRIITSLEEILRRSGDRANGKEFDPWGAQAASERLEKHFKKVGKTKEAKDAILIAGKAFEDISKEADPLVAMSWLQDVYQKYHERGFKEDALRVQGQAKEKGKNVKASLKEISGEIKIPKKELDQFLGALTSGDLNSSLSQIPPNFVPQIDRARRSLDDLKRDHPLQALVGVTIIGDDQFIARAGSVEDDPEGRLRLELEKRISLSSLFLSKALETIKSHYSPSADQIVNYLYQSPLFDPDRKDLITEAIHAYLSNDYVKAIHVLIPQIEHIFRRVLHLLGQPTNKFSGKGTMQEKNINDVLANPAVKTIFSEDVRLYFLLVLADQAGLNIRHRVSHGLMTKANFDQRISDLLINVLLTIASHKTVPVNDASDEKRSEE